MQNATLITSTVLDEAVAEQAIGHSSIAVDGPLYHAVPELITNIVSTGKAAKVSDLTLAEYSGYMAGAPLVFNHPITEPDGSVSSLSPSVQFAAGDATPFVGGTITGVALRLGSDTTQLAGYALFPNPINLNAPGRGFSVQIGINFSLDGTETEVVVVD